MAYTRTYWENDFATTVSSPGVSAGATTTPLDDIPSVSAPFRLVFDPLNANGHFEEVLCTSKTATNVNHAALTYAHGTGEVVRMAPTAGELNAIASELESPTIGNFPQGYMVNGKISVTDTGSGLTVALKTLAGADPSSTDSIKIRIGDTVRTISSALSVTKADGTNWCNAGSAELATKEVDYFVYLGYNATDGVVIGFSRQCAVTQYGDFSTTTTDERYCAISTITNAASTDYYEVVGRFAATLSAGAGYTWSVPTFTASNLIQRPIYETRTLAWAPTWTGYSSAPTGVNYYQLIGRRCYLLQDLSVGTSNATSNQFTVPFKFKFGSASEVRQLVGWGVNNSGNLSSPSRLNVSSADSNNFVWSLDGAGNVWTSSGTKSVQVMTGFNYPVI